MKRILAMVALSLGLVLTGCQGQKQATPKTDDDKTFYTIGNMFGQRLATLELKDQEITMIQAGIADAAKGSEPKVDIKKFQSKVQELFRARMSKRSEKVKKDGAAFLEKFLKSEGGQKTGTGLAYKITKPGTGKKPMATDMVKVHYHGTLVDGTVFDSSKQRGQPVSFPLNRVIKGWTEGLQLIGEGGSIRLVIPSNLAYGDAGAPPKIPGGATLVFDVDLIEVVAPPTKGAPMKGKKK